MDYQQLPSFIPTTALDVKDPRFWATEHRRRFAEDRSGRDATAYNDTIRVAAQSVILVNGGAATAILAFSTNTAHTTTLQSLWALVGLMLFALGVGSGAGMQHFESAALSFWFEVWERRALGFNAEGLKHITKRAKRNNRCADICHLVGTIAFILGCFCVAIGLFGSFKASQPSPQSSNDASMDVGTVSVRLGTDWSGQNAPWYQSFID